MKKTVDPVVTKSVLEKTLDEQFEKHTKSFLTSFGKLMSFEIQKAKDEIDTNARKYRDEILTKEDKTVAELEEIREEQVFMKNDIADLQQRVTKLEITPKAL